MERIGSLGAGEALSLGAAAERWGRKPADEFQRPEALPDEYLARCYRRTGSQSLGHDHTIPPTDRCTVD